MDPVSRRVLKRGTVRLPLPKVQRQVDKLVELKRRKRAWMMKMYQVR